MTPTEMRVTPEQIEDIPYDERKYILDNLIPDDHPIIKKVPTYNVGCQDDIKNYHDKFVIDGYEGIIIRHPDSIYHFNDRPSCLMKYKEFKDDEFVVVGYESEKWDNDGVIEDLVVWICETSDGKKFSVRPKGSFDRRIDWYNKAHKYIGEYLTVRYQEESEDGTPIFGVGIEFRNYE
jgi:hypothetical protein